MLLGALALLAPSSADAQNGVGKGATAGIAPAPAPLALVVEASGRALVVGGSVVPADTVVAAPLTTLNLLDRVLTGPQSRVALRYADRLRVRVEEQTSADLLGQYQGGQYQGRTLRLDSGRVAYTFGTEPSEPAAPLRIATSRAAVDMHEGSGTVVAGSQGFRYIALEKGGYVLNLENLKSAEVASGQTAEVGDGGIIVRPSTLAERDLASEPAALRRRLLVPGTDDEGNARTFIIEWDE